MDKYRLGSLALGRASILGEGKTQGVEKSVAFCCTILLLSTPPKSIAGSTEAFTAINKSSMEVAL